MMGSRGLRLALRIGVGLLLLVLAFRMAIPEGDRGLVETLASAWRSDARTALLCFAISCLGFGISFAVGARRFQILLQGSQLDPGFRPLLRGYIVAAFLNLVMPSAMLGDVYRFFDVRREMGQGSAVLGIVVLERLLSLAALGSIGLVVAPFMPLDAEDAYLSWVLLGLCAVFMVATIVVLQPASNALFLRALSPLARFSGALAEKLERSLRSVSELSERPALIARAFGLSVLAQWLPVFSIYMLSVPLDTEISWYWVAIIVPFVTFANLLPISIGGTGVREYLFVTLFGAVGMRAEVALTLSLSVLAVTIAWAIVGFAIFAIGRREAEGEGER